MSQVARTALVAIAAVAVLGPANPAAAEPSAVAAAAAQPVDPPARRDDGMLSTARPRIGAGLDVGLPDGATVSLVYRPIRALRAQAGLSHNGISLGQRVGLTVTPFSWWATPTLSVEYGRFAEGNANPLARRITGDTTFDSGALDRVGYQYANARLGLELGRTWFTFFVHAGVSRIDGSVHNLSSAMKGQDPGMTTVSFSRDPSVRVWSASARLGFIVYLAK
ncbi:MAG TPA: hypothetical protein VFP84_16855 [Kofleriaceae bacterium]|nr:hypothetical protein [Kofleriaceae bacterium]